MDDKKSIPSISAGAFKLSQVFSKEYEYHIPAYQRPYAWETDHAEELFDDLYESKFGENSSKEKYFLGNIVLSKKKDTRHCDVIDGQQRLTTLTILLVTIYHKAVNKEKFEKIKNYVKEEGNEFENLKPRPRLFLREEDQDFFEKYFQNFALDDLLKNNPSNDLVSSDSRKNMVNNSKVFIKRIEEKCLDDEKLMEFVRFLVNECFITLVSSFSEEAAIRIFQVMNARGLDLENSDIIKAELIARISKEERKKYNKEWQSMENDLTRKTFNELFSHIRMIFTKRKAKKNLPMEFKEHVILGKDEKKQEKKNNNQIVKLLPKKLLDEILSYGDFLKQIKDMKFDEEYKNEKNNEYAKWLNRLIYKDWIPVVIFFMSQKPNEEYFSCFLKKLERLAACLLICSTSKNQQIVRFCKIIAGLEGEHSLEKPIAALELNKKEIEEMVSILDGDVYQINNTKRRKYILLRLESFMSKEDPYEKKVAIERVLPEDVPLNSKWDSEWPNHSKREKWKNKIANLVLLKTKRSNKNEKDERLSFEDKKKEYQKRNEDPEYKLTSQVLSTESWTEEVLKKRQQKLLKTFKDNWELK